MIESAQILAFWISLGGLLVLTLLLKDFWVDEARDDLFALRDDIFLYAYINELDEHEAYLRVRSVMNSVIRYAHEISLPRFLILIVLNESWKRNHGPAAYAAWVRVVQELPEPHRAQFMAFHSQMTRIVTNQLVKSSPTLRSMSVVIYAMAFFYHGADEARKAIVKRLPLDLLEKAAINSMR